MWPYHTINTPYSDSSESIEVVAIRIRFGVGLTGVLAETWSVVPVATSAGTENVGAVGVSVDEAVFCSSSLADPVVLAVKAEKIFAIPAPTSAKNSDVSPA